MVRRGRSARVASRTMRREGRSRSCSAEGRKREVRRLLEAVGHPVRWLRRVRFGPIRLGRLPRGGWSELAPEEVRALEHAVAGAPGPCGR